MEPKVEVLDIGPERAKELLDSNANNRKMDFPNVTLYTRQMASGKWVFVGDPIRVSVTGRLLDGQNRLLAIIQSKTTQKFVFISNLPDDSQTFMDVGKKRSAGDVFRLNGIANAFHMPATIGIVLRYDAKQTFNTAFRISHSELLDFYGNPDNTLRLDEAVRIGTNMKHMLPISPTVCAAVHFMASRVTDAFEVHAFFEKMHNGLGLEKGSPIAALRNWLIRREREDLRVSRYEAMWVVMRAWNAWAMDEKLERIQLPTGGLTSSNQMPKLVSVTPRPAEPVTKDNPVVTPYSRTRKEMDTRKKTNGKA